LDACECARPAPGGRNGFIIVERDACGRPQIVVATVFYCLKCGKIEFLMIQDRKYAILYSKPFRNVIHKVNDLSHEAHVVIPLYEIGDPPYIALCGRQINDTTDIQHSQCEDCRKLLSNIFPVLFV